MDKLVHNLLSCEFHKKAEAKKVYFKKSTKNIEVYTYADGYAYKAPYRFFEERIFDEALFDAAVEKCFPQAIKRKEWYYSAASLAEMTKADCDVRLLGRDDQRLVDALLASCTQAEQSVAMISCQADIHPIGAFVGGRLAAVSTLDVTWKLFDVALIVHPAYRNKGLGTYLAWLNSEYALQMKGIAMYRIDEDNVPSRKIAEKLGYQRKAEGLFYEWGVEDGSID